MKIQNNKILPLATALAVLALHSTATQEARAAGFVGTEPMNKDRAFHSATLLPNGKVLVAGKAGNTVELFDPTNETWTLTGALRASRSGHSATLLPNGKVLVAGGEQSGSSILASAELYDPTSGTWTLTARMGTARELHTATLLPNGKVLVAGGFGNPCCGSSLASAELYDPATGTWTATGSMSTNRDSHTATLLPNGKVLVAGGYDRSGPHLSSAELYDPLTGTWTVTGSLSQSYADHRATLLPNGKVLVAGGCPCRDIQGDNPSAEVYDPANGTWTPTGPMITGRGLHTATLLLNGKVLVAGGYGQALYSAELYDPTAGTWTETAGMSGGRWAHTATLLANGEVLVTGGNGSNGYLSSAELYQPDPVLSLTIFPSADQTATLSWSGAGTLEETDSLTTPNWQPAPSQANPQTNSTTAAMKFYRVKAD